jgi:hypothetical protein
LLEHPNLLNKDAEVSYNTCCECTYNNCCESNHNPTCCQVPLGTVEIKCGLLSCFHDVYPGTTIDSIKKHVHERFGYKPSVQILCIGHKPLEYVGQLFEPGIIVNVRSSILGGMQCASCLSQGESLCCEKYYCRNCITNHTYDEHTSHEDMFIRKSKKRKQGSCGLRKEQREELIAGVEDEGNHNVMHSHVL